MFDPSLVSTGKHEVTYTYVDANNCEYSDSKEITVGPLHPMPEGHEMCITATALYLPEFIPNSSNWSGPGLVSQVFVPDVAGVSTRTLNFDYEEEGCSARLNVKIKVNRGPLYLDMGPGIPVCADDFPRLTATLFEDATYSWTGPNNFTSTNPSPLVVGEKEEIEGTYDLTVTIDECTVTSNIILSILDKEEITINHPTTVCESQLPLLLSATPATGVWSGEGVTQVGDDYVFNPETGGVKTLRYTTTDVHACENSETVYMNVQVPPVAYFDISRLRGSCYEENSQYQLFANVLNPQGETFKWYRR